MDVNQLVISPFETSDRHLVETFFDQMGGETRAFFDLAGGNRKGALDYFEGKDTHACVHAEAPAGPVNASHLQDRRECAHADAPAGPVNASHLQDRNTVRWLALDGGRMVGYLFLWDLDTGVPWLGICVAEDCKGKHLGRRLMQTARDFAEQAGKGGILLTTHVSNIRGQGLYGRCGYERMGMHTSGEVLYLLRL